MLFSISSMHAVQPCMHGVSEEVLDNLPVTKCVVHMGSFGAESAYLVSTRLCVSVDQRAGVRLMLEFRFVSFHLGSCCTFCSHFVLAECAYFLRKPTQLWGTAPFILRALEYLSQHDLLQRAIFGLMVSVFGWKGSCQVSFLRSALVGGVCDFHSSCFFFRVFASKSKVPQQM